MTSCISPNGTAFDLHGPADGAVVVLIHGLGLTRDTWADHVPALAQRYRVLSYDLAGHGDSAKPMKRPSLSLFSDQLREFAIRGAVYFHEFARWGKLFFAKGAAEAVGDWRK